MQTAVQRWGNSLALRIPKTYAAETRISEGSKVDLSMESGALVVRPVAGKKHSLAELLQQVTPGNLHDEVATGSAVGREAW